MARRFIIFSDKEIQNLQDGILFGDWDDDLEMHTVYVSEQRYKQLVDEGFAEDLDA